MLGEVSDKSDDVMTNKWQIFKFYCRMASCFFCIPVCLYVVFAKCLWSVCSNWHYLPLKLYVKNVIQTGNDLFKYGLLRYININECGCNHCYGWIKNLWEGTSGLAQRRRYSTVMCFQHCIMNVRVGLGIRQCKGN